MNRFVPAIAVAAALCAVAAGCSENQGESSPSQGNSSLATRFGSQVGSSQPVQQPAGQASPPFAGAQSSSNLTLAQALEKAPQMDSNLLPLREKYEEAQTSLKQESSPSKKQAFVTAAYNYGHAIEYSDSVTDPRVKYRAALLLYSQALKVDPSDKQSKSERDQIVRIYTSMGMPVPK